MSSGSGTGKTRYGVHCQKMSHFFCGVLGVVGMDSKWERIGFKLKHDITPTPLDKPLDKTRVMRSIRFFIF